MASQAVFGSGSASSDPTELDMGKRNTKDISGGGLGLMYPRTQLPRKVRNLINNSPLGILATCSQAGQPHSAVVFFYYYPTEEIIYFFKSQATITYRNLYENPNVAITIDQHNILYPQQNFGVMLRGVIIQIIDEEKMDRVLEDLLNNKYHSLPKNPKELIHDYNWLVPPDRRCFMLKIATVSWWQGPYFGRINYNPK